MYKIFTMCTFTFNEHELKSLLCNVSILEYYNRRREKIIVLHYKEKISGTVEAWDKLYNIYIMQVDNLDKEPKVGLVTICKNLALNDLTHVDYLRIQVPTSLWTN